MASSFRNRIVEARKAVKPCPHCGLKIVQTDDHKHPCAYCGKAI